MANFIYSLEMLIKERKVSPVDEACCVLTARLLARDADMEHLFRTGTKWWERANVWDPLDPYSSVRAAAEVAARFRGMTTNYAVLTFENGTTWKRVAHHLKLGKWYFVQGWRENQKGKLVGHTWLMKLRDNSVQGAGLLIESSETRGLRINERKWRPGDEIGPPVFLPDRILRYQHGIGIAELW